ncbi:MAG: ribosome maturation factor RimM [Rectinema sp.]
MEPEKQEKLVAVARVGAPRGLAGYVRLKSYSGETEHLKRLKVVTLVRGSAGAPGEEGRGALGKDNSGSPEAEGLHNLRATEELCTLRATIVGFEEGEWGLSAHFAGYDSPEKARELTGYDIMVPRSQASPLKANEWYLCDLVGLKVVLDAQCIGEVAGVLEGGADPLLEILMYEGGTKAIVPFRSQFIGTIDTDAGSLELLAGWLLE